MLVTTKDTKNRNTYISDAFLGKTSAVISSIKNTAALEPAVRFLMAFSLSFLYYNDGYSPFAFTFASISGIGTAGICAQVGAVLGYLIRGIDAMNIRYIVSSVLAFLTIFFLRTYPHADSKHFRPAVIAVSASITGTVFIYSMESLTMYFLELGCVFLSSYAFRYALSPIPKNPDMVQGLSIAYLVSALCASLNYFCLWNVLYLGAFSGIVLIMMTGYKCGYTKACPLALVMGIIMDTCSGREPFFTFVFAFGAIISSMFSRRGSLIFALSYVLANLLAAYILRGSVYFIPSLYAAFAASIIFMLIPSRVLYKYYNLFPAAVPEGGLSRSRLYLKDKIDMTAMAFKELCGNSKEILYGGDNLEDVATVFDRAAEISCRNCKNMDACWHGGYETTVDVLNNLTPKMLEEGSLSVSDFPDYFIENCEKPELFVSAINSELRSIIYKRQYRNMFKENLSAAYSNYADLYLILKNVSAEIGSDLVYDRKTEVKVQKFLREMEVAAGASAFKDKFGRLHIEFFGDCNDLLSRSGWLDKLSEELSLRLCTKENIVNDRLTVLEAEPYCVSVGVSSLSKDKDAYNGDNGKFFKTDDGIMYVILSDGVGTGKEAEKISKSTIRVLELFLRAGIPPEMSLRILSDAMILKNEADIYSATIDLLCIDLFTGSAKMYKSGASPSYIKSGKNVVRVKSSSLVPGFKTDDDFQPDTAKMHFEPGSTAVIISDGILSCCRSDKWLMDFIKETDLSSPSDAAKKITSQCERVGGRHDDMTAICVNFDLRK